MQILARGGVVSKQMEQEKGQRRMNDLISRKAAIEAVSDCGICIQHILDLQPAQQWIPVKERLPEHQQEVVIKTWIGATEVMRFRNDDGVYFYRFGIDESVDWYEPNEVKVWMPLPEESKDVYK